MQIIRTGRRRTASVVAIALSAITATVPAQAAGLVPKQVDPAVLALFLPLCVLVLAIVVEAIRVILREDAPASKPPRPISLPTWRSTAGPG